MEWNPVEVILYVPQSGFCWQKILYGAWLTAVENSTLTDYLTWRSGTSRHSITKCLSVCICLFAIAKLYALAFCSYSPKKYCFIVHSAQIFFICVYLNYKLWSTHNMHSHSTCLSWAIFMDLVVKRRWWCPYACLKRFYYLCRYLRSIYASMKLVPPQFLLWLEILVVVVWW